MSQRRVFGRVRRVYAGKALIFCAGIAAGALYYSTTRAARTRRRKKTFMKINIEPNWASLQKYHRARLDEIHVSWDALDEISAWLGSIDSNDALAEMREYFLGRQK